MKLTDFALDLTGVSAYIDGGSFAYDLAEINLEAAQSAFQKVSDSADPGSQMWSVINHLEAAEASLVHYTSRMLFLKSAFRSYTLDIAKSNLVRVRLIMATCYLYLNERRNAHKVLRLAEEAAARVESNTSAESAGAFIYIISNMPLPIVGVVDAALSGSEDLLTKEQLKGEVYPAIEQMKATASGS